MKIKLEVSFDINNIEGAEFYDFKYNMRELKKDISWAIQKCYFEFIGEKENFFRQPRNVKIKIQ